MLISEVPIMRKYGNVPMTIKILHPSRCFLLATNISTISVLKHTSFQQPCPSCSYLVDQKFSEA